MFRDVSFRSNIWFPEHLKVYNVLDGTDKSLLYLALFSALGQRHKRKRQTNIEKLRIFGGSNIPLMRACPHHEIGYSNKVLELIKHMYSVDHK